KGANLAILLVISYYSHSFPCRLFSFPSFTHFIEHLPFLPIHSSKIQEQLSVSHCHSIPPSQCWFSSAMAERKLNLNAPLLSVRRFSSPIRATEAASPADSKILHRRCSLPMLDQQQQQVTEPVAVPFNWEQIPGRRKDDKISSGGSSRFPVRWVPGIVKKNQEDKKFDIQTQVKSAEGNGDNDDEDDDDRFSDAVESLSAMDSCSMKCSVSGTSSSSNCLAVNNQSGSFATDPQTRDFMMSRFLPAAKAMTLDQQPHYSAKKQQHSLVAVEQQQSRHQIVVRRLESAAIVPYQHPKEVEQQEESEEEDCDDDEYEESVHLQMKACGFFPRLCFKNSICLFSPVPGMKVKSLPSFSSSSTGKTSKAASSRSSSSSRTRKSSKDDARQQRPSFRGVQVQSPRTMEVDQNSRSDSFSDRQMSGRISPFSRRGISPHRNSAPQSPFGGTGPPRGLSKEAEMFKRNKPYLYCKGGSKSQELTPLYRTQQAPTFDAGPSETRKEDRLDIPRENVSGELSKALVCTSLDTDSGDSSSLPPILPKTPSESWLWRTLPTTRVSRASSFRGKWVDSKTSSTTTTTTSKWESMVKSSYMHHDHVRYSEELVPHSSQHLTS
ncbi:hypothetical protein LINGRAPRIM_LOCUS1425, partial [Linum grandiflorum]